MRHEKYKHIEGVWRGKMIDLVRLEGYDKIDWCVTEKVHGSNFAFYLTKDDFRIAKRNSFIGEAESFYQCRRMTKKIAHKIREMWDQLCDMGEKMRKLIVYGELCGGNYPHKDVPGHVGVKGVQPNVYYSPDIEFYCFDIMINDEFIDMGLLTDLCDICEIMYAEILHIGTFDECLNYSNEFQTTIPDILGLPPIEGNICEGIVIKPVEPRKFSNGDRVILKSKNVKFMEKERLPKALKGERKELSPYGKLILEPLKTYINENRVRNVLSKYGEFYQKDYGDIFDEIRTDILHDFNCDYNDAYWNMDDDDEKIMKKLLGGLINAVWRPIFLKEVIR